MNQTPLSEALPPDSMDKLDRALSDFFKAQLPRPWAAAPEITSSEPSVLVGTRNGIARLDSVGKSRFTLAVSVALLLGLCWFLSDGFAPSNRNSHQPAPGTGSSMLGGASAGNPAVLKEIRKDKAGKDADNRPRIELP